VPGVGLKSRFRHYVNLHRTEARLERLLADFRWDRVDRVFDTETGGMSRAHSPAGARAAVRDAQAVR